jgi:hypothetical protein
LREDDPGHTFGMTLVGVRSHIEKVEADTDAIRRLEFEERLTRASVEWRTDPRLELIVYVAPGVEEEVRKRLQVFADELIDLTGDVIVIQRHELATIVDLVDANE